VGCWKRKWLIVRNHSSKDFYQKFDRRDSWHKQHEMLLCSVQSKMNKPRLKQKKIENYQAKLNKIRKLSREQTLLASTHPPTEIRTDHGNETSIYILNIYLFLTLVS